MDETTIGNGIAFALAVFICGSAIVMMFSYARWEAPPIDGPGRKK